MRTTQRILLSTGAMLLGLMGAILLATVFPLSAAVNTAAAYPQVDHCVKAGDSIQAAINAAGAGDFIAIEGGVKERLVIAKSLVLAGGWGEGCSQQPLTNTTIIDAEYLGRAITIIPDNLGEAITVSLKSLSIIQGNASGLGGVAQQNPPGLAELKDWIATNVITDAAPAAPDLAWEGQLVALHKVGAFPGGSEGLKSYRERLQGLLNPERRPAIGALQRILPASLPRNATGTPGEVDCCGGVYARNASLELSAVSLRLNIASRSGVGYGGGLCVVNLPPDKHLVVRDSADFQHNTASEASDGTGGAVHVDGGDADNPNPGEITIGDETFFGKNNASSARRGRGGHLAVYNSGALTIQKSTFVLGLAGGRSNDMSGETSGLSYGGAFFLQNCPQAKLSNAILVNNMAYAGGIMGFGGAAALINSGDIEIGPNVFFGRNTAQANLGLYGAPGFGGALFLLETVGTMVHDSVFEFNAACHYSQGYGSALTAAGVTQLTVKDNQFLDNTAAFFPNGNLIGGAVALIKAQDAQICNNEFQRIAVGLVNQKDYEGVGPGGGGIGLDRSSSVLIEGNSFTENSDMFAGVGHGADIDVAGKSENVEIAHNTFTRDVAVRSNSIGVGSSVGEGAGILIDNASRVNVHHNLFENNAAATSGYNGSVIYVSGFVPGSDALSSAQITINANRILNSGYGLAPEQTFATKGLRVNATEYITVTNNIVANTTSLGMQFEYRDNTDGQNIHALVVNYTLVNNGDYGIALLDNWPQDFLTTTNNIVMSHTTGMATESFNTITVDHNLFYGNSSHLRGALTETASVFGAPHFVDLAAHDYALGWSSPARDAGTGIPPAPVVDIEGVARPFSPAVDIGAYEFHLLPDFFPIILC